MKNDKRTAFVVSKRLQYSFLAIQLVCALIAFGVVFFAADSVLASVKPIVGSVGTQGKALMQDASRSLRLTIFCAGAFVIVMMILWGLVTLQKVTGPLYRLYWHMQDDAREGRLTPVYFRKNDFFKDLSEAYNYLVEKNAAAMPEAEAGPGPGTSDA